MKNKTIISVTLLSVFIMLMIPAVSAVNAETTMKKQIQTKKIEKRLENKILRKYQEFKDKNSKILSKTKSDFNFFQRMLLFILGIFALYQGIAGVIGGIALLNAVIFFYGIYMLGIAIVSFRIVFGLDELPSPDDNKIPEMPTLSEWS